MAQDLWSTPDRGIRPGQQTTEDPLQSEFRALLALDNNPPVSHDAGETDYLSSVILQRANKEDQKVGKHKKSKHSTSRTSTGREAFDVLANTAPVGGMQSTSESVTPAPPATPAAAPVLSQVIKCLN